MQVGLQYVATRKGLMAGTSSTAHAITRTDLASGAPDVMIRVYHISGKDRYSRSAAGGIDDFPGFSLGGFQLHPRSRGSIHATSADAREFPRIEPNYFTDELDRRTVGDAAAHPPGRAAARAATVIVRRHAPARNATRHPACSTTRAAAARPRGTPWAPAAWRGRRFRGRCELRVQGVAGCA